MGITMITFIILGYTNPGFDDIRFAKWLEKEHGIYCTYDGNLRACKQIIDNTEKNIRNNSGGRTNTGLYTEYRRNVTFETGERTEIRALGLLNMIFNK
ncbi:hypothetical protein DX130_02870 [Paenibacillus paeoniae]|uniref:Uncharacterized protein n=1 Tax=Paenibacillus paeoniae TaxID=2292705 RepID=A0A371PIQ3_9BACL|nr:hypothetical protein DX130_02870 [Paenibacillus paeoniae]